MVSIYFVSFDTTVLEWWRKKKSPLIMTAVKKEAKPPRDTQTAVYMLLYV